MAKIKFGNIVADARGKTGGVVYSRNSYGGYVRQKVTPVNPRSAKQTLVRGLFGGISATWRNLTDPQRQQFIDQAPAYSRVNVFGDNVPLTGSALYQKLNLNLVAGGAATINTVGPPLSLEPSGFDSVTISVGGPTANLVNLAATGADDVIIISATPPQSAGRNFIGRPKFRQLAVKASGTAAGNYNFAADYLATFGIAIADLTVGTKIGISVKRISTINGQPGVEYGTNAIVAA